jgi:hypothetical protein
MAHFLGIDIFERRGGNVINRQNHLEEKIMKKKIWISIILFSAIITMAPEVPQGVLANETIGCFSEVEDSYVVFGIVGTKMLLGSTLTFNNDGSFTISGLEETGSYTVVVENFYLNATLSVIDETIIHHFSMFLFNQILLCVGYTTEGSEANPMYGYWGFLGFKIE